MGQKKKFNALVVGKLRCFLVDASVDVLRFPLAAGGLLTTSYSRFLTN